MFFPHFFLLPNFILNAISRFIDKPVDSTNFIWNSIEKVFDQPRANARTPDKFFGPVQCTNMVGFIAQQRLHSSAEGLSRLFAQCYR